MTLPAELAASIESSHARARPAQIALAFVAVADLGAAVALKMQEALLAAGRSGIVIAPSEAQSNDDRVNLATRAALVLTIVTGVLFLRWFQGALHSARWLRMGVRASGGDAIAAFFIPFANLMLPFAVMRELHTHADPSDLPLPADESSLTGAPYRAEVKLVAPAQVPAGPIALWWLSYLAMTFVSLAAAFMATSRDLESLTTMSRVAAVGRACGVVSAVFCILVIRAVDRRLVERARRQAAMDADPAYAVDAG